MIDFASAFIAHAPCMLDSAAFSLPRPSYYFYQLISNSEKHILGMSSFWIFTSSPHCFSAVNL